MHCNFLCVVVYVGHLSRVSTYCLDFENSIPKFVEDFLQCEKSKAGEFL